MPDQELQGRVAVITGAGRSIGRAMALELAAGGAAVVVNVRQNRAEAESVVKEIEGKGGKAMVALAQKVRYRIDPDNPYPDNFTGHIRMTLRDGSVIEERQPHMRGGAHEPLSRQDIEDKFLLNARHGGYDAARAQMALKLASNVFGGRIDLSGLWG